MQKVYCQSFYYYSKYFCGIYGEINIEWSLAKNNFKTFKQKLINKKI